MIEKGQALSASQINKSSVNVLRVLSAFASTAEFRVSEISLKLGMTKNMAFRALRTLVEEGYLVRDADGVRYSLGFRVFELRNPNVKDPDIRSLAWEFMERMQAASGLTVALQIPVGFTHVTIDGIEGEGRVLARVVRGVAVPLHVSPASRAILAFLSDQEIETYIRLHSPLKAYTDNTITDPERLRQDVQRIRQVGYALGYQDHFLGVNGVAFPVFDMDRRPHGAITVVGPEDVVSADQLRKMIPLLQAIIDELNGITRLYHAAPIIS
jgi:DNA-binding IclR family transcriptional regulator